MPAPEVDTAEMWGNALVTFTWEKLLENYRTKDIDTWIVIVKSG